MPSSALRPKDENTTLVDALQVFVDVFGLPESDIDLKATVAALIAVMDDLVVAPADVEAVIRETVAVFKQQQSLKSVLEQVATDAQGWLKQQERELLTVVSGYVQKFAPTIDQTELTEVIQIAVSMLGPRGNSRHSRLSVTAAEAKSLATKVLKSFDLDLALRQWIPPEIVEVAQQVADYRAQPNFESGIMSVAQAVLNKFDELVNPELIKQIIENGGGNFDPKAFFKGDIDVLSNTIYLRWQLQTASPKVTKSDEKMADEIYHSIENFRKNRLRESDEITDLTQPIPLGDLEVGSPLHQD